MLTLKWLNFGETAMVILFANMRSWKGRIK